MEDQTLAEYPKLTSVRLGSTYYNCHSYAWYDDSASNPYWISNITAYANDVHHSNRTFDTATVGNIVVYKDSNGEYTHSAVITEITTTWPGTRKIICRSKWGQNSVYEHEIDYVHTSYYKGLSEPDYIIIDPASDHEYGAVVSYNSSGHTQQCMHCSETKTFSHHYNAFSICTVCSYRNPGGMGTIDGVLVEDIMRK